MPLKISGTYVPNSVFFKIPPLSLFIPISYFNPLMETNDFGHMIYQDHKKKLVRYLCDSHTLQAVLILLATCSQL